MKSNVVFKVIGVVLFFTAITFLVIQIVDFFRLPASYEAETKYAGMDFIKYKESALPYIYFWALVLLVSFGIIKRKNIGWIAIQSLLFIGLFEVLLGFFFRKPTNIITACIIVSIYSLLLIGASFLINLKKVRLYFNLKSESLKYYYPLVLLLASIYWIIYLIILNGTWYISASSGMP